MNEDKLVNFNVKVENDIKDTFKKLVKKDGKIIHFVINEMLKQYIEEHSKTNDSVKVG